jgi:hypothetical protein
MNLKKIRKAFTSKFVGTGPSSYKKRIYRAAVSQRLRNTALGDLDINVAESVVVLCKGLPWNSSGGTVEQTRKTLVLNRQFLLRA